MAFSIVNHFYKACPLCKQGRLIIQKNLTKKSLYLHCEECEQGWHHPSETSDISKGFLTLNEDFESENPTIEEIANEGWEQYVTGSFQQ